MRFQPFRSAWALAFLLVLIGSLAHGGEVGDDEKSDLDTILRTWARRAESIKRFDCEFTRWEYSSLPSFVDANGQQRAHSISTGKITCQPKGGWEFEVTELREFNRRTLKYDKAQRGDEHWVNDGRDLWEIIATKKTINQIPAEAAFLGISAETIIAPIRLALFGDKVDVIRRAYEVEDVTAIQYEADEVWLRLIPRDANSRRMFDHFVVLLKRPDMSPYALRMVSPAGSSVTVFEFRRHKVNNVFAPAIKRPEPSKGWKVHLAAERATQGAEPRSEKIEAALNSDRAPSPQSAKVTKHRRRLFGIGRRACGRR